MLETKSFSQEIGSQTLTVEFNRLAEQANGRVIIKYGDLTLLVTACMSKTPRPGIDFMPLTVEYEEKYYAAGRILGSRFIRRESRPSEEAILSGRLIDRTIRPRFDSRMRNDIQIVVSILSVADTDPDTAGIIGASLALGTSNIPWNGPVAAVRVARIDGALVINPTYEVRDRADIDIVVSGTEERINMLEAEAKETSESDVAAAIAFGHEEIKKIIAFQKKIIAEQGAAKADMKLDEEAYEIPKDIREKISSALYQKDKKTQRDDMKSVEEEWTAYTKDHYGEECSPQKAAHALEEAIDDIVHTRILESAQRPDGRAPDELRELHAEVGILPRVHGSGLFIRGQTQALTSLTLGGPGDSQVIEGMEVREKRRFMHHYNFPPFSTGEVKPMRGPGRREIGHGALAERALSAVIPPKEEFPYTIRLVSEILSSNGSSSMAATTAGTLALMDGGVPIKKPVTGIAMGLMMSAKDGELGRYVVLTDIQGPEDHYGDMDLKIAGTRDGITALQMDVKIEGVTLEILQSAFQQAKKARFEILSAIEKALGSPRKELSPYAPRIMSLKINPEKIGALIGPGGKNINDIVDKTGAQIDIEDDGTVFITAIDKNAGELALKLVKSSTREVAVGEIFEGKVTRIFPFGAMVEIAPKQEGLVHISEISDKRVDSVVDYVRPGKTVTVKVKEIDAQGRINLTMKGIEQNNGWQ